MPDPETRLALRQADQARCYFCAIEADLEMIMARLAGMPTRAEIWRTALIACSAGRASCRPWRPCPIGRPEGRRARQPDLYFGSLAACGKSVIRESSE